MARNPFFIKQANGCSKSGTTIFFKKQTTLFSGFVSAYAFFGIVFGRDFLKMHVFKCLVSQTIDHRAI